ncbi:MAG: hypothetical protein Hals2KO_15330 [Halioglobus sp.]
MSALGLLILLHSTSVWAAPAQDALSRALGLSLQGKLHGALQVIEEAQSTDLASTNVELQLLKADVLRRLGLQVQAQSTLETLHSAIGNDASLSSVHLAQLHQQQALLFSLSGEQDRAQQSINAAMALKDEIPPQLQAKLLNIDGLIRQQSGDTLLAIERFNAAAGLAANSASFNTYKLNEARAMLEDGRIDSAIAILKDVTAGLKGDVSHSANIERIATADLYRVAISELHASPNYRSDAFSLLDEVRKNPDAGAHVQSIANGSLAQLYFDEDQFDGTLHYARIAIQLAEKTDAQDLLYRWEWLRAKAYARTNMPAKSIEAYSRAVSALRDIRQNLQTSDSDSFSTVIKPLFYEYADSLLSQATTLKQHRAKQEVLQKARAVLEEVKVAEVQDYFDEQCVGNDSVLLDQLADDAAVLYPVLLDDRLELLLSAGDDIDQIIVPVEKTKLISHIRDFRINIEADTGTDDYLRHAQQLYDWLIRPLETRLALDSINTLVVVPDGALRTIPLAALHNGDSYLIEKFALATTPGLTLLDPKPFSGRSYSTLAGGISDSVQGFNALPAVDLELQSLEKMLNATVLQNDRFTLKTVKSELTAGEYSLVHFATHGKFGGSYDDSFLLTHDDKLLISDLGRSIQLRSSNSNRLELLVLSACETAAGDDRAALGLAGVALKAGARSALATLWEVDDNATLRLIDEFYSQLAQNNNSRAESLQRAQLQLVNDSTSSHPSKWAPFLLIGNWL